MEIGARLIVQGLVQGVGFRYFVLRRATGLGLTGHVTNLYDGSVEIVAEGSRSGLEELIREVKVGPRAAAVRDVKIEWLEPTGSFQGFDIR